MSHPADDQRILAEIEGRLSRDDPALASLMNTLNQQFPQEPTRPEDVRPWRRNPRIVAAVVLSVIALLGLILTAALGSPSTPPAEEGPASRPAAMAMFPAP